MGTCISCYSSKNNARVSNKNFPLLKKVKSSKMSFKNYEEDFEESNTKKKYVHFSNIVTWCNIRKNDT